MKQIEFVFFACMRSKSIVLVYKNFFSCCLVYLIDLEKEKIDDVDSNQTSKKPISERNKM